MGLGAVLSLSVSGLMCLHDVACCLCVSEHGCVWWGWARSCLSESGLMCLHDVACCLCLDVSCCLCVSEHGRMVGLGAVLSLCVWCYGRIMDGKTLSCFLFHSDHNL